MVDPNPPFLYAVAKQYSKSPVWYRRHKDYVTPAHIAHLVDVIDFPLINNTDMSRMKPAQLDRRMRGLVSVILRWWCGCINMAKVIALETRDGPNTPEYRNLASRHLLHMAKRDAVYADGIKAAPAFKELRGQEWYTTGIDRDVLIRLIPAKDLPLWLVGKDKWLAMRHENKGIKSKETTLEALRKRFDAKFPPPKDIKPDKKKVIKNVRPKSRKSGKGRRR